MAQVERKCRIFFYSGYSFAFRDAFRNKGIIIEHVLDGVHPFAMVGKKEESMQPYLKDCVDITSIVSIKKNFENMISKEEALYESNYVKQPYGKEVTYYNDTEYLVVDLICLVNELFCVGDTIYSDVWPRKAFAEAVKKQKKIPFPFVESFNWRYYSKLFADACLKAYDSKNIILIRTNPARYYYDNDGIHTDSKITSTMSAQFRAIEDDFISRTHCHCIEEFLNHSPIDQRIFVSYPDVYDRIAEAVAEIVFEGKNYQTDNDIYNINDPIIKSLYQRLTNEKLVELQIDLEEYEKQVSVKVRKHFFENDSTQIYRDLQRLSIFLTDDSSYGLLDYVKNSQNNSVDLCLVDLYTRYFKLEISDIVAFYLIYRDAKDKKALQGIIHNICQNKNCKPIAHMKEFLGENQTYLKQYKYLDEELRVQLNFDINSGMASFPIRMSDTDYLILSPHNEEKLVIHGKWKKSHPKVEDVINDMCCRANELDEIAGDWSFYIKRAKAKKGNVPLKLQFKNGIEFQQSLAFVNYRDVLESENAVILLEKNVAGFEDGTYISRCNFEPIMADDSKIFLIRSGLTDQIHYYIMSKYIEELSGAKIFYDDLLMEKGNIFNGIELGKVVKEGRESFNKKRLSKILSPKLINSFDTQKLLADFLYEKGWKDITGVVNSSRANLMNKCSRFIIEASSVKLSATKGFKFYCGLIVASAYLGDKFHADKYLIFPNFTDKRNLEIEKQMLSCDAVVLHFRMGDYVTAGNVPDLKFFKTCLNTLYDIKEYTDLKYFIFSDDIPQCKAHEFDIFGKTLNKDDVYYIDYNKRENSYLDMKLMSLGKIIIASNTGFSFMAAAISKRKEIYVCQSNWRNGLMRMTGFKNRYELNV